jgi:hypothetical protein
MHEHLATDCHIGEHRVADGAYGTVYRLVLAGARKSDPAQIGDIGLRAHLRAPPRQCDDAGSRFPVGSSDPDHRTTRCARAPHR